jgi:hypothetical protein
LRSVVRVKIGHRRVNMVLVSETCQLFVQAAELSLIATNGLENMILRLVSSATVWAHRNRL